MAAKEEWKNYKTRLTGTVIMYCMIPFLSALVVGHFSLDAARKFSPNDPTRIFFVGIPALVSVVILLSLIVFFHHYLGRAVRVKGRILQYKDRKTKLHLDILNMAYSPPGDSKFKTIMISDGKSFVQIPELFLGKQPFAELAEHIRKNREQRMTRTSKTYSL